MEIPSSPSFSFDENIATEWVIGCQVTELRSICRLRGDAEEELVNSRPDRFEWWQIVVTCVCNT